MKPIRLSIKGLNSFEEEQNIDFVKLTSNGFFGIFGPTGSGKSTILDAITLSLYGTIPRDSDNFINLNTDRAYLEFEFQISGAENKRYVVQREFKRDAKTLRQKSGKCKLVDITYDEHEVLEENVKAVTSRCEEIIGLGVDDFMRTVVLPQGKFSEFLKLKGLERRNMLERLFNLYEYGDNLRGKVSKALGIEKDIENRLGGELTGIGSISQEDLTMQEELIKTQSNSFMKETEEFKIMSANLESQKEFFNLQNDKQAYEVKLDELLKNKPEIDNKVIQLGIYKKANQLKEVIDEFEKNQQDLVLKQTELSNLDTKKTECSNRRAQIDKDYSLAKDNYDNKRPDLIISKQKYTDALDKVKELKDIKDKMDLFSNDEIKLTHTLNKNKLDKDDKYKEVEQLKKDISEKTEEISKLKVSSEYRAKVSEGYQLELDLAKEVTRYNRGLSDLEQLTKEDEQTKKSLDEINEKLKNLMEVHNKIEIEEKNNEATLPGTNDELNKLKDRLNKVSLSWKIYNEKTDRINKNNIEIKDLSEAIEELSKSRLTLKSSIESLKTKIESSKIENLALELRRTLTEGQSCPVCGGLDHPYIHDKDHNNEAFAEDIMALEGSLKTKEKELEEIDSKLSKLQPQMLVYDNQNKNDKVEIDALDKEFLDIPLEKLTLEYEAFEKNLRSYESKKIELDTSNKKYSFDLGLLEKQAASLGAKHEASEQRINAITSETKELQSELKIKEDKLNQIKTNLDLSNLNAEYTKISDMEKQREISETILLDKNKTLALASDILKAKEEEINLTITELSNVTTRKLDLETRYDEQKKSLIDKVGDIESIATSLDNIDKQIKQMQIQYQAMEKSKEDVYTEFTNINETFIKLDHSISSLNDRIIKSKENLEQKLVELEFADIKSVKDNFKGLIEIEDIEKEIKSFETNVSELKSVIKSFEDKLSGRTIDKEAYLELEQHTQIKQKVVESLNESLILEKQKYEQLKTKFNSAKEILEKIKEVEKRKATLQDLESLFKGNKFVEFVAIERLKYVTREASKRLLDITGGEYSMETDDDGIFLIKDNKNGGILRETSTLSGGETFLASLALALSLSAEIQLKGAAPLELFFLDEGFGTLDDDLLEVLMTSLEKIHHDKLKVGVISHVESVKQRVPVKLIVTPAKAGISGSTIIIEQN